MNHAVGWRTPRARASSQEEIRIECTVMPIPREEGKLPQLLRVTMK